MHTYLRVRQGHQDVTDYCPLDLFSGDEQRVVKALNALWDAWIASNATVNNLKIFAQSKFVKPSEVSFIPFNRRFKLQTVIDVVICI